MSLGQSDEVAFVNVPSAFTPSTQASVESEFFPFL